MTIKEVEECTGLSRSNVRFYEKEGLISPARNRRMVTEITQRVT